MTNEQPTPSDITTDQNTDPTQGPTIQPEPQRALLWILSGVVFTCGAFLLYALAQGILLDGDFGLNKIISESTAGSVFVISSLVKLPAMIVGVIGIAFLIAGSVRVGVTKNSSFDTAKVIEKLDIISERLLLSDTAKRIAYRRHDIEALRRTIQEDIAANRFDAALALVSDMSKSFGYLEESENYRDQIRAARRAEMESKITSSIATIEAAMQERDFEKSLQESNKLIRLYPESERAKEMPARVIKSRSEYAQQLEREFLEAASGDNVEKAMELIKNLDKYLTTDEAEPLREVARGVIGKQRDNLGIKFKMAVHDKNWSEAVTVGEQLIQEFPNTRMAAEVRSLIDELRKRAADQKAAQSVF